MKFLRLSLLTLPFILFLAAEAQDPDTSTFQPENEIQKEEENQIEMQEEEEKRTDSFGNDLYNENDDSESLKIDEEETLLPEYIE